MAAAHVGRVQGPDQVRCRGREKLRRAPGRCRDCRNVSEGIRRRLHLGTFGHCGHCLFRDRSRHDSQGTDGSANGYFHRVHSRESSLNGSFGPRSRTARLGLLAGAILYAVAAPANAQVVPPPASEIPIPVKPKTDSGPDSAHVKVDSIKPTIGRVVDPLTYEIGSQYEWNRAQLFATGALSLVDLLDRIPGIATFRSGWLSTPQTATFGGDFRRVRIFYDGLEIDNLDNSTGGVLDLSTIQLWSLEHLTIERTASELRLYIRSWRVENTDPYTRVDVATGNEDTNLYRGFYGKRYDNGAVFQFAGQQYGVASPRLAGSGDALSMLGRIGVAKKRWSVDAFVNRVHSTRDVERPAL